MKLTESFSLDLRIVWRWYCRTTKHLSAVKHVGKMLSASQRWEYFIFSSSELTLDGNELGCTRAINWFSDAVENIHRHELLLLLEMWVVFWLHLNLIWGLALLVVLSIWNRSQLLLKAKLSWTHNRALLRVDLNFWSWTHDHFARKWCNGTRQTKDSWPHAMPWLRVFSSFTAAGLALSNLKVIPTRYDSQILLWETFLSSNWSSRAFILFPSCQFDDSELGRSFRMSILRLNSSVLCNFEIDGITQL